MSNTIALRVPGSRARLRVRTASSWRGAVGLLGNRDLRDPHGLWVRSCRRIHTFGLIKSVDVVFLRADRSHPDAPQAVERPVIQCSTYAEARRVKQGLQNSGRECVIRFVGATGGGD